MVSSARSRLTALTLGLCAMVLAALALAFATGLTTSSAAAAETSCGAGYTDNPNDPNVGDFICVPDANLQATLDKDLGFTEGTPITVAEGQRLQQVIQATPVANLTGLEAL
jgi:hypothetical protein